MLANNFPAHSHTLIGSENVAGGVAGLLLGLVDMRFECAGTWARGP
jgi:hypothetical protein